MRLTTLCLPAALLSLATGCGIEELGVLTIHMTLHPVPVDELPVELADLDFDHLAGASGTIHSDVPTGTGTVDALELPVLPDGFVYVPMLTFMGEAREGLPATTGGGGGHSHGAGDGGGEEASGEAGGHDEAPGSHDEDGGSVETSPLSPVAHDSWVGVFSGEDIGGFELGALRSGMVLITGEAGPISDELDALPVLSGEVEFSGEGSSASSGGQQEEAGHAHGV